MARPTSKNTFREIGALPEDFEIFLHETDLADIRKNWNHNFLAFTAVSRARNEVVYYAEAW
jgi:hypothetical protein